MIVNLAQLPWRTNFRIVDYCLANNIEIKKCHNFIRRATTDLEMNIPDEHITILILKGIFDE